MGAVGSERINSIFSKLDEKFANIRSCTLHALHKGHLKDLVCCLYHEYWDKKIIHANISSFSDNVLEN